MEDIKVIILTLLGVFLIMSFFNSPNSPVEKFTNDEVKQHCDKSNKLVEVVKKEADICDNEKGKMSINDELYCRFTDDRYIVSNDDASSWCDSNQLKDGVEVVNDNTYDPSKQIMVEEKKKPSEEWNVDGYDGKEYQAPYSI